METWVLYICDAETESSNTLYINFAFRAVVTDRWHVYAVWAPVTDMCIMGADRSLYSGTGSFEFPYWIWSSGFFICGRTGDETHKPKLVGACLQHFCADSLEYTIICEDNLSIIGLIFFRSTYIVYRSIFDEANEQWDIDMILPRGTG
jgi:hypothetical protein